MTIKTQPSSAKITEPSLLLTVSEAAVLLHRSRARVYELLHMREIAYIRDGKRLLIPREALGAWITKKTRQNGFRSPGPGF